MFCIVIVVCQKQNLEKHWSKECLRMFRRNILTPFYTLNCVALKHYTHLPECTTDNMQNQNLDLYRKIPEYFHSQLSNMKIWSCFITHCPAALSHRRPASTAIFLGRCDAQVNVRETRFNQIILWISRRIKDEISKIYCHRFRVVFSPRKKVKNERHKEKGKGRKTILTQTKEFQKHQYKWICRFAGLWMNQYFLCLLYLGLPFLLKFFAVGDWIADVQQVFLCWYRSFPKTTYAHRT
jgi:hypothetical protein